MRGQKGKWKDLTKINDCLERSLNGLHLKEEDKEMKAMIAYIEYMMSLKAEEAKASGIYDLDF
jgi:thiosulfate dehydrogenase